MGAWWRWALVSLDGVAPRRIVVVSASVNLPLHHKVQKFSSGTGSPRWPEEMAEEQLRCGVVEDFVTAKLHTAFMPLLTATSTFRLWRRCQNFPHWCYLHRLHTTTVVISFRDTHKNSTHLSYTAVDNFCNYCIFYNLEMQTPNLIYQLQRKDTPCKNYRLQIQIIFKPVKSSTLTISN